MKLVLLPLFALVTCIALAQPSILGKWKTIDENTGKARSIVEIGERKGGEVFGKVIRIFNRQGEDPDPVCDKCPEEDARYNKKVIGMEIIHEMLLDGEEYSGGNILDPEVGKVYRCKLWLEDGELKVRGYIGPFYRTQTWVRFIP